ncbi:hypothetical protein GGR42_001207 [Saonia flava]|uniref:Peptidase E n=1 Tax=Saonia flava TaxID=523696 RepID=A0A846QYN3_9FLAO|nr:DUF6702 family protein [Saonia flava]NJB70745.1 hypothetical protein [Saonia flava]
MRKKLLKGLLVLLLPLFAFTTAHKFYLSVTSVKYSEKEDALQITSRIFIDDFEKVLDKRFGIKGNLATKDESPIAMDYIEKYLKSKLVIKIDGEVVAYDFLGKEYDDDIMVCYIEIPKVNFPEVKSIEVQNEVLFDLFVEQQNVVHFRLKDIMKSFVLIRENNKGMLKL